MELGGGGGSSASLSDETAVIVQSSCETTLIGKCRMLSAGAPVKPVIVVDHGS